MPQSSIGDASVAKNLSRILDAPESKLDTYLQSRDEKTLQSLRATLQSMPGTDWPSEERKLNGNSSPVQIGADKRLKTFGRAQSAHSTFGKRVNARDAQDRMNTMKSSYGNSFGGRSPKRDGAPSPQVFGGGMVRSSYKPQLDEWQQSATAEDLETLADTCRSIRTAGIAGVTSPTSYGSFCSDTTGAKLSPPRQKENSRNVSRVPFGSMYVEPSEDPLRRSDFARMRTVDEGLRRTRKGDLHRADFGPLQMIQHPPRAVSLSAHKCFMESAHPGNTNSSSRSAWNTNVHAKGEIEGKAYGPAKPVVMPGENLWHECSNDIAYTMGIHHWPRLQAGNSKQLIGVA